MPPFAPRLPGGPVESQLPLAKKLDALCFPSSFICPIVDIDDRHHIRRKTSTADHFAYHHTEMISALCPTDLPFRGLASPDQTTSAITSNSVEYIPRMPCDFEDARVTSLFSANINGHG